MFYDVFIELCNKKGVKPGRVAEECGINRSNVSLWKSRGYTPRGEALNKLAAYFGVDQVCLSDLTSVADYDNYSLLSGLE